MLGGHPIKLGLSRYIIDLIERGLITHVATNGAGIIHDFELALVGGTSEDVAHWINVGQFGLWQETSRLNDIISEAAKRNEGLGEAVGRVIEEEKFPHRDLSIAAAGWRCGVPVTCHVTIGGDIIHAHPNCNGAALGQTSYLFLSRDSIAPVLYPRYRSADEVDSSPRAFTTWKEASSSTSALPSPAPKSI